MHMSNISKIINLVIKFVWVAGFTSFSATADVQTLPKPDAEGWINLFNGKDLTGWSGDPKVWSVKDGYISGAIKRLKGGNTFLVYQKKDLSNYILEADIILVANKGNSGIQYRSKHSENGANKWVVKGYQADFANGYWGKLYEEGGRKTLVWRYKNKPPHIKANNEWNKYRITANGSKLKHELNGTVTIELDDKNQKRAAKDGVIALQYHSPGGFEVRFRNIRIKLLGKK